MRKQRRHSPMLELLDERIVPSGVGMAPIGHAALAEHAAIHRAAHEAKVEAHALKVEAHALKVQAHALKVKEAVHAKAVHNATVHRIVPAVQVSSGSASSSSIIVGSPVSSPPSGASAASVGTSANAGSTSTTRQTQVPTVAPVATATSTSVNAPAVVPITPVASQPATTNNPGDTENGPLAKAGQDLITIYEEFQQQGGSATFTSSEAGSVEIEGTSVGVDIHSAGGNFANLVSAMTALGMKVQTQDATHGIIEGLLPIGQLLSAAQNSQTRSLNAVYIPRLALA